VVQEESADAKNKIDVALQEFLIMSTDTLPFTLPLGSI